MRMILTFSAAAALLFAGCGTTGPSANATNDGKIKVVAAENFWGSIASQVGGDKVNEVSIITNPATDPHDYDPTAQDSRTIAEAQVVIVNGVGYDDWASKLIAANPNPNRKVLNVGDLTSHKTGDNPHRWYSPTDVQNVTAQIATALAGTDTADTAYFDNNKNQFLTNSLSDYNKAIADIKANYMGVPVGATESIFAPLAADLGVNLITPDGFLNAISEGDDPTADDKSVADEQITDHKIKVLVFNSQNATPDVQRMVSDAKANSIPVVSITETLSPAGATFQQWQTNQLENLENALKTGH